MFFFFTDSVATMLARYKASMVLSGVGDAIGYANGHWEFEYNGEVIHKELRSKYGCISKLKVKCKFSTVRALRIAQ